MPKMPKFKIDLKNKYIKYILSSILGVIIALLLFFGLSFFGGKNPIDIINNGGNTPEGENPGYVGYFTIYSGDFDKSYKKIPENADKISFYFNNNVDKNSVNNKNITIKPELAGNFNAIENKVVFTPSEEVKLKKGQNYLFSFSKKLKDEKGKNLLQEKLYNIEITKTPEVVSITPSEKLNNLNQSILVLFNSPMVPLATLDKQDSWNCPITLEPSVEGKCKWTSTSSLEFIPSKNYAGFSDYKIKVLKKSDAYLYDLEEDYDSAFTTPDLKINAGVEVSKGIYLTSNFAIDLNLLKDKVRVNNALYDYPISNIKKISDSKFLLEFNDRKLTYDNFYNINLDAGLKTIGGNKQTKENRIKINSGSFLSSQKAYKQIFDEKGKETDSKYYRKNNYNNNGDNNYYIPTKDVFFNLTFNEEISLDKNLFTLKSENSTLNIKNIRYTKIAKDGKKIYNKNKDKNEEETLLEDNKKGLRVELPNLKQNTAYSLVISKEINPHVEEDIVIPIKTKGDFDIVSFKVLNYNKACLYTKNDNNLNYNSLEKNLVSEPKSIIKDISSWEYIPWNLRKNKTINYEKEGYCKDAPEGQNLYVINLRLNPYTKYDFTIKKGLRDRYYSNLKQELKLEYISKAIKQEDKYVYNSLTKSINVIPKDLDIITNIQTINTDSVTVEVCEMNEAGYANYKTWQSNYKPQCVKKYRKTLRTKDNFWNLTNNTFDIEKDIIKTKLKSNIILIRGSSDGRFNLDNGYKDEQREFSNIYIRSNLALALEKSEDKNILLVTDIYGKNIINNIKPDFYGIVKNKFQKLNIKYSINKTTGAFEFNRNPDLTIIKIQDENNFGILNTLQDRTSNSDFKYYGGQNSHTKDFLYLYTDRPLYKPGDTVFFKGLLRTFDKNGYKASSTQKGKLKVISSDYKEVLTLEVNIDKNSNFNGKFILPKDVKLGRFSFEFKINKARKNNSKDILDSIEDIDKYGDSGEYVYNNGEFFIEEYRKPDFKIDVEQDSNKNKFIGSTTNFKILPTYYFGGKLVNTEGSVEITTQDYFFDAKDYSNYQFGEGYKYFNCLYWGECGFDDRYIDNKSFKIDENGAGEFSYKYPTIDRYEYFDNDYIVNGEKIYTYNFKVKDPNTNRSVTKKVSEILHSTDGYIGLDSKYYQDKNNIKAVGIILDLEAKPKVGAKAKIKLIKQEWKNIKKQGVDGVFYNNYSLVETPAGEKTVTSNNKGEFSVNFKAAEAGTYKLEATYTGSNNKSFVSSLSIYGAGKEFVEFNNGNNDVTNLAIEKGLLKVGDTAEFTIQSPVNNGTIAVFVEKDDGILDYFVEKIDSNSPHFKIKIKDNYYPNVYFKAYLLGKDGENPLPVYKRALGVVKVSTDYKKLNIKINSDKTKYLPGAEVKLDILVTDQEGNPVNNTNGSIAIVDESLLALKGNPKKNPYAFFYDMKRYLGVGTYLSLVNLIEKLEVKDASQGEKGGDGEKIKGGDSKKKRGTFKDTAYWLADFVTNDNGKAEIITPVLPDNLTTWNIEIVANKADTNQIGVGYSTFKTSKNLIINDNLPRFFGSNDIITLSPVIFNKSDKDSSIKVSLTGDNFDIIGKKSKVVILKKGESETVNFDVKIKDIAIMGNANTASSTVNIKAENNITLDIDEIEKIIPIKETSTKEVVATSGKTTSNTHSEKINLGELNNRAGTLEVNYAASLLGNIITSVRALEHFPYGCSEQKTSALLPTILIKQLYNNADLEFDLTKKFVKKYINKDEGYKEISLDEVIKKYLISIYNFQNDNGGFVYFADINGNNVSNFYLTSYMISSLKSFEKVGYKLDEKSINKAISYLKTRLEKNRRENCFVTKYNDCKYSYREKLRAINALITTGENSYAYKAYKTLEYKEEDFNNLTKLNYALVTAKLINTEISKTEKDILEKKATDILNQIINDNLVYNSRGAFIDGYNNTDMTAIFIETVSTIGLNKFENIDEIIYKMIKYLNSNKTASGYGSTQNNINIIKAVIKYLENSNELKEVNIIANLKLNSSEIDTKKIDNTNKLDVFSKNIELKNFKEENDFVIEKSGSGNIYYDLVLNYYKDSRSIKARDEGFGINIKYYDYNEYQKIKALQKEELNKIRNNKLSYDEAKYQKEITSYLDELTEFKVGELVYVKGEVINNETRENVYLESFIPAGSELVNTNLETESSANKTKNYSLDKTEYRNDRFFGFRNYFYPGKHEFNYILRATHAGNYQLKPTKIGEFYTPEVFGRTEGKVIVIK